jgi:hypothetical protein
MAVRHDVPDQCPACHSPRVATILYGLPHFTPELEREMDDQRVVLGGCVIFEDSTQWHCVACGHRWGSLEWMPPPHEGSA